jgi:hypothetical protein
LLLDFLGELVFEIIGEAVVALLSPDWPAAKAPPEEGVGVRLDEPRPIDSTKVPRD